MIWHLPFIRAIAAAAPGGSVTFLTLPSTHAAELLQAEPSVAKTIYFEHGGSEFRRGLHLVRLVAILRRCRFKTLWIFDRTMRPALAARLAGIPERIGLGLGPQRAFITNAGIGQEHFHDQPIDWLRALMETQNIPLPSTEPQLHLRADLLAAMAEKYRGLAAPVDRARARRLAPEQGLARRPLVAFHRFIAPADAGHRFSHRRRGQRAARSKPDRSQRGRDGGECVRSLDRRSCGAAASCRSVRRHRFRPDESRRRRRHSGIRPVRLDARSDLFEVHPRTAAGRWNAAQRPTAWRAYRPRR